MICKRTGPHPSGMRPGFYDTGEGAGTEEGLSVHALRCGSAVAALLDPAVAEVKLSLRPLLREEEIEADGLGAELAAAVEDPDAISTRLRRRLTTEAFRSMYSSVVWIGLW